MRSEEREDVLSEEVRMLRGYLPPPLLGTIEE